MFRFSLAGNGAGWDKIVSASELVVIILSTTLAIVHESRKPHAQSMSNVSNSSKAGVTRASLYTANECPIHARLFGKLFLGHAQFLATRRYDFSQAFGQAFMKKLSLIHQKILQTVKFV
jgi:hypothetical protein